MHERKKIKKKNNAIHRNVEKNNANWLLIQSLQAFESILNESVVLWINLTYFVYVEI